MARRAAGSGAAGGGDRPSATIGALIAVCLALLGCSSTDSSNPPAVDSDQDTTTISTTTTVVSTATTGAADRTASPGCGTGEAATPGTSDRTIASGGEERAYQLVLPEGYDGTTPIPVVFALHGLSVDHRVVPRMTGFGDMAATHDFIGVSPSGRLDGTVPYWAAVPIDGNRDVAFFADLLDHLGAELCIDPSRVYATGMSNGGQMSSLLGCQLSERVAAVAPVAGVEWPTSCDGGPVPVLAFHGDADPIVTYEGGGLNARTIADLHHWEGEAPQGVPAHRGVEEAMANWADHNGCRDEPAVEDVSDEVREYTWQGCEAPTILYRIIGGGHTWPNEPVPGFEETFGHTTTDIDATELMFEFFLGS